jgi:alanine racemase
VTSHRATVAEINLNNLIDNYRYLKSCLGEKSFFCPMIKANAYGHGAVAVAKALTSVGAENLGVALLEEALELRQAGIKANIFLFGVFASEAAKVIIENQITPVVSEWHQLDSLASVGKSGYPVHIKFDTGMHRLGFSPDQTEELIEFFSRSNALTLKGVCTHLFLSDDLLEPTGTAMKQLSIFEKIWLRFAPFDVQVHALNSGGIINALKFHREGKIHSSLPAYLGGRPGISLYGANPFEGASNSLKPVMTIKSNLVKIQRIKAGEGVSYGHRWTASRDSFIGVVPIGYGDGFHRAHSNKAQLLWRGQKVSVIGTVCMDYLIVDLTSAFEGLKLIADKIDPLHEEVVLLGQDKDGNVLRAEDLGHAIGTIPYEIFTNVGSRVPREYIMTEKGI